MSATPGRHGGEWTHAATIGATERRRRRLGPWRRRLAAAGAAVTAALSLSASASNWTPLPLCAAAASTPAPGGGIRGVDGGTIVADKRDKRHRRRNERPLRPREAPLWWLSDHEHSEDGGAGGNVRSGGPAAGVARRRRGAVGEAAAIAAVAAEAAGRVHGSDNPPIVENIFVTTVSRQTIENAEVLTSPPLSTPSLRIQTNSEAFVIALTVFLCCVAFFRLLLVSCIAVHWRKTSVQLAQPSVLVVFVLAGAAAAVSCITFLPLTDLRCRLREPLLLTSITLMETVLVGRVWRISMLMGPALIRLGQSTRDRVSARRAEGGSTSASGRGDPRGSGGGVGAQQRERHSRRQRCPAAAAACFSAWLDAGAWTQHLEPGRQMVMDGLAALSHWELLVDSVGRLIPPVCRRGKVLTRIRVRQDKLRRQRKKENIRQSVPTSRLSWLIFVLMVPQVALQLCNLTIPSMAAHRYVDIYDTELMLARYECRQQRGMIWSSILGVLLVVAPCILLAFLSIWSENLPAVLNEAGAVKRSSNVLLLVLFLAGPSLAMSDGPDARAYLKICIVLGLVLPPCWYIVVGRCWDLLRKEQKKGFHQLLRTEKPPSERQSENSDVFTSGSVLESRGDQSDVDLGARPANHAKTATLALTIGKMYESMGATERCVTLFDEALDIWKIDPGRKHKELIGGFTEDEIDSFTSSDLDFIIQLLIAKGRVEGTYNSEKKSGQKHAARAWVDALDVYERAPSSISLADRSVMFPVFSGLFVFLKGGKITDDKDCTFEQNLAAKFVRETRAHGDPVHYTRALAMQAEVLGRLGRYREALALFDTLRQLYSPEKHSDLISQAYGTDRSSQCFSYSALLHIQLLEWEEALERCEYVINELVPRMDPANILNMTELLLPVIKILKDQHQAGRMRDLFREHVVDACTKHLGKDAKTPAKVVFKPLGMLLDVCDEQYGTRPALFPDLYENIAWLVQKDSGTFPDFVDTIWAKVCWAPSSMTAELCLLLAEKITACNPDKKTLIQKGLGLAKKADSIIRDEGGKVKYVIANGMNEPVLIKLENLNVTLYGDDSSSFGLSCSNLKAPADIRPRISGSDKSLRSSASHLYRNGGRIESWVRTSVCPKDLIAFGKESVNGLDASHRKSVHSQRSELRRSSSGAALDRSRLEDSLGSIDNICSLSPPRRHSSVIDSLDLAVVEIGASNGEDSARKLTPSPEAPILLPGKYSGKDTAATGLTKRNTRSITFEEGATEIVETKVEIEYDNT